MIHLGDITKINGAAALPANVIIGGSPCQDLSVAGKRAGLAGERSGLFMEQIRIIKEMRENDKRAGRSDESIRPQFMVWENVPGAFSSNKGEDFRAVLEETVKVVDKAAVIPRPPNGKWSTSGAIMGDGWSIAWRVLDAQFWGVPQRRRRIALVADFGGTTAAEILFERKGVSGNIETCGAQRKGTAADSENGVGTAGSFAKEQYDGMTAFCLRTNCRDADRNGDGWIKDVCYTLTTSCHNAVAYETNIYNSSGDGVVGALDANYCRGMGARNGKEREFIVYGIVKHTISWIVRRLTPLECERLQGFPDGWTDIGDWTDSKSKVHKSSDSARYKALGNSIALPPWTWILQRLSDYCGTDRTMASLFDGIGGFPLIWERINGKGSCLWASEIEEFPIAVTKLRFGE